MRRRRGQNSRLRCAIPRRRIGTRRPALQALSRSWHKHCHRGPPSSTDRNSDRDLPSLGRRQRFQPRRATPHSAATVSRVGAIDASRNIRSPRVSTTQTWPVQRSCVPTGLHWPPSARQPMMASTSSMRGAALGAGCSWPCRLATRVTQRRTGTTRVIRNARRMLRTWAQRPRATHGWDRRRCETRCTRLPRRRPRAARRATVGASSVDCG